MTKGQIIYTQKRIGTTPDSFWGPKSIAACHAYLRKLMPKPHPSVPQSSVNAVYGPAGESRLVRIKFPYPMFYGGVRVASTFVHEAAANALVGALDMIRLVYTTDKDRTEAGVNVFDGVYNDRNIRGGNVKSMHAYGLAIDLDAARNGNHVHWPTKAHMPIEAIECFTSFGWTCAGPWWGRDGMHSQFTQP